MSCTTDRVPNADDLRLRAFEAHWLEVPPERRFRAAQVLYDLCLDAEGCCEEASFEDRAEAFDYANAEFEFHTAAYHLMMSTRGEGETIALRLAAIPVLSVEEAEAIVMTRLRLFCKVLPTMTDLSVDGLMHYCLDVLYAEEPLPGFLDADGPHSEAYAWMERRFHRLTADYCIASLDARRVRAQAKGDTP